MCVQGGTRQIGHGRDDIRAERLEDEPGETGGGAEGEGGAGGEESDGTETGRGEETRRGDRLLEENKSTTQGKLDACSNSQGSSKKPLSGNKSSVPEFVNIFRGYLPE